MIETEGQRRWWFATHPEYSRGHKGVRSHAEQEGNESKIDPKEADAWAEEALQYERDPLVIELIKEAKFWFGTAFESKSPAERQALLSEGGDPDRDDRVVDAQNRGQNLGVLIGYGDRNDLDYGDMPRLPTTEELSQWPKQIVREFFGWLDEILQNNPLLIDPNALEGHHGLPKKRIKYFMDCGLNIKKFIMIMRAADHRLKPDGLHTGKGLGGDWSREWDEFIDEHPAENTPKRQKQIEDKLEDMKIRYRINEKIILSSPKPKKR